MNGLINQIEELYFLGGNLNEILRETQSIQKKPISKNGYIQNLFKEMFKNW